MSFGERMQEIRIDKGLIQKDIADLLKVTVATISHYEQNTHSPDVQTIAEISKFLNVSSDYLLGIINEPMPIIPDKTIIRLPLNFPKHGIKELKDYINYLILKYKNWQINAGFYTK